MTERELRKGIVNIFIGWLGLNEADGSHMIIVDIYNGHKPLARGYKVKKRDAWCAAAGSAAAIVAGLTDIIPTECGCGEQIKLWQKMGRWQEADDHIPDIGDYIYYDWDDSGKGDNTGWPDHVGMVVEVNGSTIKVIEGNKNDQVDYRCIEVNARYIRGYGLPDYAGKATEEDNSGAGKELLEVDGFWGTDTTRRLQQIFKTTVDGKISNQREAYRDMNPGLVDCWEWVDDPGRKYSYLIKAMQRWAGMPEKKCEGWIGPDTISAFQKKLGTVVDGSVSYPSAMVRTLQKWANEQ